MLITQMDMLCISRLSKMLLNKPVGDTMYHYHPTFAVFEGYKNYDCKLCIYLQSVIQELQTSLFFFSLIQKLFKINFI